MWKLSNFHTLFTRFSHTFHMNFIHIFHMHVKFCLVKYTVKWVWNNVNPFTHIFTYSSHGVSHRLSHVTPHWMAKEFHMVLTCKFTHFHIHFKWGFTCSFTCICMLLHGFKNQQQKHALKQCFEETQVNNTPFRVAVPFTVLYTVDIWLIWIFRNFIFALFPIFPTGPVHTPCKMKLLLSDLSV